MTARPSNETLESLRVTLQRLEQTIDPSADAQSLADLKHILLVRIAELEALNDLTPAASETHASAAPASETVVVPVPLQESNQNPPAED
jgi:hypothetical protein